MKVIGYPHYPYLNMVHLIACSNEANEGTPGPNPWVSILKRSNFGWVKGNRHFTKTIDMVEVGQHQMQGLCESNFGLNALLIGPNSFHEIPVHLSTSQYPLVICHIADWNITMQFE